MTFPGTPRDLVAEMYLNGWVDITTDVRQTAPITTKRARGNEQGKTAPATSSLTLNNGTGNYSPRNPLGAYYGQLGRNVPVRHALRLAKDTFTRTVVDAWGTTDTGHAWSVFGGGGTVANSNWQVNGTKGTHSVPAVAAHRSSYLATLPMRDTDVAVSVTLPFTDVTGGDIEPANILLRGQTITKYYLVRVVITTTEAVTVAIRRVDGGETVLASPVTVPGLTHSSAQSLRVRAQIEGRTLRAKVWAAASLEPYDWNVSVTDSSASAITTAGWVGVRSGVATANTNTLPIVFSYDDLEVRSPRFAGEIAKLTPRWDETHKIKTAKLEAAGILRRLGQGASPVKSAPRRFITANTSAAYWPMEDNAFDLVSAPLVGTVPFIMTPDGTKLSEHYGQGKLGSYLPQTMNLTSRHNDSFPSDFVYSAAVTVNVTIHWAIDVIRNAGLHGNIFLFVTTQDGLWRMAFGSTSVQIDDPWAGSFTAQGFPQLSDNAPHHYRLEVAEQGSDVASALMIDGVTALLMAHGTHSVTPITRLHFEDNASVPVPVAIGHLVFWGDTGQPSDATSGSAALGWAGETAGRRLERLCAEEGIDFSYVGDLDDTTPMGPQGTKTLLALLRECEDADQGTLYEPRGVVGLAYRTRTSIYSQTASLALDYVGSEVAPPLEPTDDDQATRNKVTVKRLAGGEYTATLATGPMSVLDPQAGGVGVYDEQVTVNVQSDARLPDVAHWRVHLGTVNEARFGQVRVTMAAPDVTDTLEAAVLDVNVDDRLTIANLAAVNIYDPVSQIARGYTETLTDAYRHDIAFNCAPESPYQVMQLDTGLYVRLDSDATTLNEDLDTTETGVDVAISDGILWTTAGGDLPFDVMVNGERMTVTAVSGASSPQTFTVTRSVNGVVRTHTTGDTLSLADPGRLG